MKTPEIPTPQVIYDPFFNMENPDPPYKVEVNNRMCGVLLKGLGMSKERITGLKIVISPQLHHESRWNGTIGGQYDPSSHTIFYYPTDTWNTHQHLLTGLRLMTQDSTIISTAIGSWNSLEIRQGIITRDSQPEQSEKEFKQGLREFVGKHQAEQVMKLAKLLETLQDAENILLTAANKLLRDNMGHELRHSKDLPPSRIARGVSSFTSGVLPFMSASLAVSLVGMTPFPISSDGPRAAAAILTYLKTREVVPRLMYAGNFGEIRARKFAKRISDDPSWQDLVRTDRGWGEIENSDPHGSPLN